MVLHWFASKTVTVYTPAARPDRSSVVSPFDHANEYGGTPPVISRFAAPLLSPLHSTSDEKITAFTGEPEVISARADAIHPWLSVTVTVYVPETAPVKSSVVLPS